MSRARKRQSKLMTVPTLFEIKIYLKPRPTSLDDIDMTFLSSIFHALRCYKGTPSSSVIAEQIVKGWFSIGTDGAAYSQFLSPCLLCQWPWSWSSNSSFRREEGTMGPFCSQFTHIQQPMLYCHGYKVQGGGQLLIVPTPFPNYGSGYTVKSGNILCMWQKIKH